MISHSDEGRRLVDANPIVVRHIKRFMEHPEATDLNLPIMFQAHDVDRERLETAVNRIVTRHEALRSTFCEKDGKIFQVIWKSMHIHVDELETLDLDRLIQPFDLINGPCMRVGLCNDVVFIDVNHLFMDGISYGLLYRELNQFYAGREARQALIPPVEELRTPPDIYAENTEYWKGVLSSKLGNRTVLHSEKDNGSLFGPGSTIYYPVKLSLMKRIKEYGLEHDLTPNEITSGAYVLLLAQRNHSEDISYHTDMSCRNMKNISAIGLFTNPVTMRYQFSFSDTSDAFYSIVRNAIREGLKHQSYNPHGIGVDRDDLDFVGFVYQREMITEMRLNDEICIPLPIPEKEIGIHEVLSFFASKKIPLIQFEYRNDMYSFDEMTKFIDDYIFIIDLVVNGNAVSVQEIIDRLDAKTGYAYEKKCRIPEKIVPITELLKDGWSD